MIYEIMTTRAGTKTMLWEEACHAIFPTPNIIFIDQKKIDIQINHDGLLFNFLR